MYPSGEKDIQGVYRNIPKVYFYIFLRNSQTLLPRCCGLFMHIKFALLKIIYVEVFLDHGVTKQPSVGIPP